MMCFIQTETELIPLDSKAGFSSGQKKCQFLRQKMSRLSYILLPQARSHTGDLTLLLLLLSRIKFPLVCWASEGLQRFAEALGSSQSCSCPTSATWWHDVHGNASCAGRVLETHLSNVGKLQTHQLLIGKWRLCSTPRQQNFESVKKWTDLGLLLSFLQIAVWKSR